MLGIGLDIAASHVRVARVECGAEGLKLLSLDEQSFDASQADGLGRALTDLRRRLPINQPVVLGLPGSTAILSTLNPLVVSPKRAGLAVQFEMQQQLPFDLSQSAWHYQWLQPPATASVGRSHSSVALAVAVKQSLLEERLALCRRCGWTVATVCVDTVALVNVCALARPAARAKTLSLLHRLSPLTGQWIFSSADRLQVLPIAANRAEAFQDEAAAAWKALQPQIDPATGVCLIDEYEPAADGTAAFSQRLGVAVNRFDPAQILSVRSVRAEQAQRCAAAIGLALQSLKAVKMPINLLAPMQQVAGSRFLNQLSVAITGVCLLVALVFGISGMLSLRQRRVESLIALQAREARYQQLRPAIRTLLRQQQHISRLIAQLTAIQSESLFATRTLAEVVNQLPDTVWLTRIEAVHGVDLELTFEGRAVSFQEVTRVVDQLKALPGVVEVKPLSTAVLPSAEGKDAVSFVVQLHRRNGNRDGGPA